MQGKLLYRVITNNLFIEIFIIAIFQMKESTKMHIAVQINQALLFLHTATPKMIHLDVKPSNILVSGKREYNGLLCLLVMPTFCVFYR